MQCVTVLYRNAPDLRFDFDYYVRRHIPLIQKVFGKGITRIELRKCLNSPDGSPPEFLAVISIWLGDPDAYQAGLARSQELIADVPNFTNGQPVIQIGEVVATSP